MSEYSSVAHFVDRPTMEPQAKRYWETVLSLLPLSGVSKKRFFLSEVLRRRSGKKKRTYWLFAQKPFDPPNHPKPPQTSNFPKNPVLPRIPPGIPTEFILSAIQTPTEFH